MGTTLAALNAGSTSIVLVAAVEGYDELFTNANSSSAVATAWSSTGWSSVRGGLYVDLDVSQAFDPNEPFIDTGTCTLTMVPVANGALDLFGVAVGRKTSPFETYLSASLTNTATTVTVKSTTGLSNGDYIHIGTECIQVGTVASSTSLTGCTRGCFSPLGSFANQAASDTEKSFGHYHRVTDDALAINLAPLVTSKPRLWIGRWVTVYAHRVVAGVLDTKAQAELIFAGTIADIRDDPNTGAVVMQLRPAVEAFGESVIGSSQWNGELEDDGVYLTAGDTFGFTDFDGSTQEDANSLVVVASGASGANQINAGMYSLGDLCTALGTWTAAETTAGRLNGSYAFASPVTIPGGEFRTKVYWSLSGTQVTWIWSMPKIVSTFLGFDGISEVDTNPSYPKNRRVHLKPQAGDTDHWYGGSTPMRAALTVDASASSRVSLTTKSGTVVDNPHLPSAFKSPLANLLGGASNVGDWGVFEFDGNGKRLVLAQITDNADGTVLLTDIRPAYYFTPKGDPSFAPIGFQYGSDDTLKVRQVYAFENTPSVLITLFAVSTGTAQYNSPYVDTLPLGCGAGIPFEAVDTLETSLSRVTASTGRITTLIEKPTKLAEIVRADMAVRWAAFCWHQESITAVQWRTPTTQLATLSGVVLSDSNKAEPAGNQVNHKAATSESSEWLRPVVKIRYSRDIANPAGDDYAQNLSFMDETSIDDMGGARNSITINLRNTYRQSMGQSLDSLLSSFLETLPLVSRPARKITRSIDSRYFWQIAPGDVVLLTDVFARDPETGLRGLSARPALVTKVRWSLGGMDISGAVQPMGGEVDLLFSDRNPARFAPYVPAAMVNDLYSVGSYDHGYLSSGPTLRLLTNRFTETTDTGGRDAGYFNPGDNAIIIERDPADPDAPVKWERTIAAAGVSGDDITLTSALSSPAWDNTRQYYVISQTYSAATATQHLNTYQADEADGLVEDTAQSYLYGSSRPDSTYTTNSGIESVYPFSSVNDIEMPPTLARTDGAGRDVAWEASLIRLANNLIDYKLQPQMPMLSNTEITNTTVTGTGYLLCGYWPVFLTFENLNSIIQRYLTVAPFAWSTDGTSTKIRVTISRERPSFPTHTNVTWAGTYAQYEWTGITSTTPAVLADADLPVLTKDQLGEAWISIEIGYKCGTRLLSKCLVGPREVVFLTAV